MMDKKKKNTGVKVAILVIVIVAAVVGLGLILGKVLNDRIASDRNTQRRVDLALFTTRMIDYQTNNRGQIPDKVSFWRGKSFFDCGDSNAACEFIKKFISANTLVNDFMDPDGSYYSLYITENVADGKTITNSYSNSKSKLVKNGSAYTIGGSSPYEEHIIYLIPGATCDGEKAVKTSSTRKAAILYMLEGGSIYCGNN